MAILEKLWNCWHFWQLRTSKHDNHSDLTMKYEDWRVKLDSIRNSFYLVKKVKEMTLTKNEMFTSSSVYRAHYLTTHPQHLPVLQENFQTKAVSKNMLNILSLFVLSCLLSAAEARPRGFLYFCFGDGCSALEILLTWLSILLTITVVTVITVVKVIRFCCCCCSQLMRRRSQEEDGDSLTCLEFPWT